MSGKPNTSADLKNLAHLAVHRSWKGRARSLQVLATILRLLTDYGSSSLVLLVNLKWLSVNSGLGLNGHQARDALADLEAEGWLTYELGHGSIVKDDRRPTKITLLPKTISGSFKIEELPLPTLDIFSTGQLGHAGYVIFTKVLAEYVGSGYARQSYTLGEIADLTGLPYSTVARTMSKRSEAWSLADTYKSEGRYVFKEPWQVSARGALSDSIHYERRLKLEALDVAEKLEQHQDEATPVVEPVAEITETEDPKQSVWFDPSSDWPCIVAEYMPPVEEAEQVLAQANEEKTDVIFELSQPRPTPVAPVVEPVEVELVAEVAEVVETNGGVNMPGLASRIADYGDGQSTPTPVVEEKPKAAPPKLVYVPWPGPGLAPLDYQWYRVPEKEVAS
jgi:hypothetical protein